MLEITVEYSERYLYDFFKSMPSLHSVGLMGGWAVHLSLSTLGVSHIGSRDIDIFFNPDKIKVKELITRIERLGFEPHSTFRWAKYVQMSRNREVSEKESRAISIHDLATIYLDVAAPVKVDPRVMHQPVLKKVFRGSYELCRFRDLEVLIPAKNILVEMKLLSALERDDFFKVSKDIADLFAFLNHDSGLWVLDKKGNRVKVKKINSVLIKKFKAKINQLTVNGSVENAAYMLKMDGDLIIHLLMNM